MLSTNLLLAISAATAACRAAGLAYPHDLYARQDAAEGDSVTVSTLTPESVSTSVIGGATTEVPISATTSTWTFGTESTDTTTVSITSTTLLTTLGTETIDTTLGTSSLTFTLEGGAESSVSLPAISTTLILPAISTTVSISALQTVVSMDDIVTVLSIPNDSTVVTFGGETTTITISGTSSDVTVKGPSTDVSVAAVSSEVNIDGTSEVVDIASTDSNFSNADPDQTSDCTLSYSASSEVKLSYGSTATVSLTRLGTDVTLKFESTSVELSVPASTVTVTGGGSTTEITISAVVTTITLSETSSSTSIESSETTATVGESSETTESTSEDITSSESNDTTDTAGTTSETSIESSSSTSEESTATTSSTPSTAPTPTLPPGTNPTQCEVVRGPLTPEEEVQLAVLFGDGQGGTAFADYVVSYASQLVAQIADVANVAVGDNDFAFTTAFDTIDIPGVLGLASAAPIYTCFLSTLWAQALSNPQQYAKRAVPSQDDKIKLIVLFEKRANDGMQFDYAELLVDDTNNLIAEVQSVAGAAGAAAVGGDLGAYASLFANVDVAQFLSIATEAPIYTEGLSSAFVTALESYSQNVNHPTSTVMVTSVYTSVSTIVTNVVSGTVTVPTTLFSTIVVTSVGPATSGRETYTSHTTETRMGVTSETVSEVVRESTLPNGQVTRVTERVTVGAPGERVTVETVTLGNGRVETRTVTRREGGAAATVTTPVTATRPNVAHFTEVRGGTTYVHTVEVQHENAAWRSTVGFISGIIGFLVLFA